MTRHEGYGGLHDVEFFSSQECPQVFEAQGQRPRLRPLRWTLHLYFGRYGTASSREAFARLKAEWIQNGGRLPTAPHEATITEVVVAYIEFANGYFLKAV